MATTPEGRVKQKVRDILDLYPRMYYYMPVQMGYGQAVLDFIGCYNGLYFSIETKVEGKKPTARQDATIAIMRDAGATVFVITGLSDVPGFEALIYWLSSNRPSYDHPRVPSAPKAGPAL